MVLVRVREVANLLASLVIAIGLGSLLEHIHNELSWHIYVSFENQMISPVNLAVLWISSFVGALLMARYYLVCLLLWHVVVYGMIVDLLHRVSIGSLEAPTHFDVFLNVSLTICLGFAAVIAGTYFGRFSVLFFKARGTSGNPH